MLLDTGRIVALLPSWRPLHPWAVSGTGLSENVRNGMPVRIKGDILSFGDIELQLGKVRIQDLNLTKKLSVVPDETIRQLRVVASVSEQEDPLSQVALSCLEQCRETGDVTLIAQALGAGGGLTPSGDDILVGLLAALDLMSEESCACRNDQLQTKPGTIESSECREAVITEGKRSPPSRLRKILVSALPESLHEHTTLLSAQMIEAAMVGCYPEPIVTLGGSLAQSDASWAKVERAAKMVTKMGHGSGSAMLRGFTVGLELGLAQE